MISKLIPFIVLFGANIPQATSNRFGVVHTHFFWRTWLFVELIFFLKYIPFWKFCTSNSDMWQWWVNNWSWKKGIHVSCNPKNVGSKRSYFSPLVTFSSFPIFIFFPFYLFSLLPFLIRSKLWVNWLKSCNIVTIFSSLGICGLCAIKKLNQWSFQSSN